MRQKIIDENAPSSQRGFPTYELQLVDGREAPIVFATGDISLPMSSVGARLLAAAFLVFADEVDRRSQWE
jgi:hypothetical protein